jgi:hypothetical protein
MEDFRNVKQNCTNSSTIMWLLRGSILKVTVS